MTRNLFLTGRVKCGKSTLLKQEITLYLGEIGGYHVRRIFCSGEHRGFRMAEISGPKSYLLEEEAVSIHDQKDLVVYLSDNGSWESCAQTFEETGVEILERAYHNGKKVILMDELGTAEQFAPRFRRMVNMLLDSSLFVLGVLKKERNPFLDAIRERDDVMLVDLDREERREAVERVRSFLAEAGLRG
jgi:nucleoside-triphosphatase